MKNKILILVVAAILGPIMGAAAENSYVTNDPTHPVPVKPTQVGSGKVDVIMKVTTAATGTNWTLFGSQTCTVLTVVNTTGTTISVRIGGSGQTLELPDGSGQTFSVAANANEVGVKRTDDSNTQVDVKGVASK